MTDYNEELLKLSFVEDGRTSLPHHATKKWPERDSSLIVGVCFHQSLEERGSASGNAKYHVGPNHISETGLPGLSYTLFVEKDGKAILANGVECKTYSQGYKDPENVDENALYIGVCFGGNFSGPGHEGTQAPTLEQMETAKALWEACKSIWHLEDKAIYGHFDFGKPACPGWTLMDFVQRTRGTSLRSTTERQQALKTLNFYDGEVDGEWGPKSKAALVAFQRAQNLQVDGTWGPETEEAMLKALG